MTTNIHSNLCLSPLIDKEKTNLVRWFIFTNSFFFFMYEHVEAENIYAVYVYTTLRDIFNIGPIRIQLDYANV